MNAYTLTNQAYRDLRNIRESIAEHNAAAARRIGSRLANVLSLLAEYPLMGSIRAELPPDLRAFSVAGYLIIYRPAESGITVARIVHGSRDLPSLFR